MIDIKLLQTDFEYCRTKLKLRGISDEILTNIQNMSANTKKTRQEMEAVQATQNSMSAKFGEYKREQKETAKLQTEINNLKAQKQILEESVKSSEQKLAELLSNIPNIPDDIVPVGDDENDNVILEQIGVKPKFDFEPLNHWDMGEKTGVLDFARGVKISKSRFVATTDTVAKLERALGNYFLDFNSKAGFTEWSVPFVANRQALYGTGQLPKFEEDLFRLDGESLYLIPTAEVSLTNLYAGEILDIKNLPLLLTAKTACFRKEAGSAGLDTRGMIRLHQFDKVEMVAITTQEQSANVFDKMVQNSCDILSSLGLAYRIVELCSGDLGFSATRTIDIEVWLPGQGRYREISSVSNTKEFQARRAKIRYKDGKNRLAHTLNGSALAVGRCVVAVMENYQKPDGTFTIPEVLRPYMDMS